MSQNCSLGPNGTHGANCLPRATCASKHSKWPGTTAPPSACPSLLRAGAALGSPSTEFDADTGLAFLHYVHHNGTAVNSSVNELLHRCNQQSGWLAGCILTERSHCVTDGTSRISLQEVQGITARQRYPTKSRDATAVVPQRGEPNSLWVHPERVHQAEPKQISWVGGCRMKDPHSTHTRLLQTQAPKVGH